MPLKLYKIRKHYSQSSIEDVKSQVFAELEKLELRRKIGPDAVIAVTAGSRGISNIDKVIRYTCDFIKNCGGRPIVIPSMGSHGGATAEGQINVLKKLGITEATMEAEIVSSMEVVKLGTTTNGSPVYMDKNAYESDGIIVVNRVKQHTDFTARNESGIVKMVAVGLGKEAGATAMHCYDLATTIPLAYEIAEKKAPLIAGLALVENAEEKTGIIKGILPDNFLEEEAELLKKSQDLLPKILCDDMDILVVREMGKMYSGTGMDTKVIGRIRIDGIKDPEIPRIKKLVVLDLSDASYGNALGIGLADITTRKLVDKIDFHAMYTNTIATTYLERAKIPVTQGNDRQAIETALATIGNIEKDQAKVVVIDNTLELETMYVSEAAYESMDKEGIQVLEKNIDLLFDSNNNLILE